MPDHHDGPAAAEYLEIKRLTEMKSKITQKTVVLLDLDDNVMRPWIAMGGDAMFSAMFGHMVATGMARSAVSNWIMPTYRMIQLSAKQRPADPSVVGFIRQLQEQGVHVHGLTARGNEIAKNTVRALNEVGIDFSKGGMLTDNEDSYYGGVIFCGGDKRKPLQRFIDEQRAKGVVIEHIAFSDDKLKHVKVVAEVCEANGIKYDGFRNGSQDAFKAHFNEADARQQLFHHSARFPVDLQRVIERSGFIPADVQKQIEENSQLADADPIRKTPEDTKWAFFSRPSTPRLESGAKRVAGDVKRKSADAMVSAAAQAEDAREVVRPRVSR